MAPQKILVTGGSGQLGQMFSRHYGEQYALRLTYNRHPIEAPGHEAAPMDLADYASVRRAMQGVEAVVHLGADPLPSSPWESILANNLIGTYNVYEAAREAGVRRVIFASSNHAAGYLVMEDRMIGPDAPVRPDSFYGVSKAYGESLGSYYHDAHGLEIICLRIGSCHGADSEAGQRERVRRVIAQGGSYPYTVRQLLSMWLHPRDMSLLIHRSLQANCAWGIFYGISDNTPAAFDLSETRRVLGYVPQYRVQDFVDEPIS